MGGSLLLVICRVYDSVQRLGQPAGPLLWGSAACYLLRVAAVLWHCTKCQHLQERLLDCVMMTSCRGTNTVWQMPPALSVSCVAPV